MTSEQGAVLVTGGAGYIGSHAVLELLDRGEKVVVFDDLSTGLRAMVPEGALFEEGSVGDFDRVTEVLKKYSIDTIMHFAALVKVEESVREPLRYKEVNTEYTKTLLRAAGEAGVKNFIFSSTCALYGNAEHNPISEDTAIAPVSPYAETKQQAEEEIQAAAGEHRIKFVILRYFNVAGTDASGRSGYKVEGTPSHLIRGAVRALLERRPFTIYGTDYPTPDGTDRKSVV